MGKAKIPEPKAFGGARGAREVDNFIFDMKLYFDATKNDSDAGRLKIAPMYLANDAKLWWRTKVKESISGQCSIGTWNNFKKELKAQFILKIWLIMHDEVEWGDSLAIDIVVKWQSSYYIMGAVQDNLKKDLQAVALMQLAEEEKTRQFWLEDGILMTRRNRVYIPKAGNLRNYCCINAMTLCGQDIRARNAL
ncbi:hypothetical protein GH714_035906 [Hevea brasiliensis]|uniref:Retrotransposon gag domain-containing protein n=1 Tax=Hevea brasiliensis TaxID=3981 RepID=A0A6A6LWS7_HEVBR|nr:hypothetical protein GH714_035906 [Hevea brasiliensis]